MDWVRMKNFAGKTKRILSFKYYVVVVVQILFTNVTNKG